MSITQKLSYTIIGSAITVILMTVTPVIFKQSSTLSSEAQTSISKMEVNHDMKTMNNNEQSMDKMLMHTHPLLETSTQLPIPSVTHLVFPDIMGGYNVQILTRNFEFTPASINLEPKNNTGHAHIYVNDVKVARVYSNWFHIPQETLNSGENFVRVTLNANNHSEWSNNGTVLDSTVRVEVKN